VSCLRAQRDVLVSGQTRTARSGLISLNISICTIFLQDLGHLPQTKIQKFLHEPVNVSRTLQGKEYLPVTQTAQADAISTPQPREGISYHG